MRLEFDCRAGKDEVCLTLLLEYHFDVPALLPEDVIVPSQLYVEVRVHLHALKFCVDLLSFDIDRVTN